MRESAASSDRSPGPPSLTQIGDKGKAEVRYRICYRDSGDTIAI